MLYEYGLTVYCDFSNYTFIEMLNDTAIKYNVQKWLYFKDCVKLRLEFRIGKNIALMASERLNISINAQALLDEFRLAVWDEKSIKQINLHGLYIDLLYSFHNLSSIFLNNSCVYFKFNSSWLK